MRPRINPACLDVHRKVFCREVYTIQGRPDEYFHRKELVDRTKEIAIRKQTVIVILMNGYRFFKIHKDGFVEKLYNPALDNKTSPSLKRFFIEKDLVMAHYGKVA